MGVKMLVIPLGADQPVNAAGVQRAGSGLTLDHKLLLADPTKSDVLGGPLRRLLTEPSFQVGCCIVPDRHGS